MLTCAASPRAEEPLVFDLKYTKAAALILTLTEVAEPSGVPLEFTAEGNRLSIRGGDAAMRARVTEVVKEIDAPCIHISTRFIKVRHISAEKAAAFMNKVLSFPKDEVPIQAVPAARTPPKWGSWKPYCA